MSFVITGSEGFIGKALVSRLAAPFTLIDQALGQDICDPLIGDLIPEDATIIHLAAISTNEACEQDITKAVKVNVEGTRNLVRAAVKRNAKQFILASSEWVYEGLDGLLTEDRELAYPARTYPMSKIAAENAVRKLLPDNHTILRFGIVYGPRREAGSAVESIFRDIQAERVIQCGSKDTARRFIHVEDIVSGFLASQGHYGTYNLTGNALASLKAVAFAASVVCDTGYPILHETDPDNPSIRDAPNDKARITFVWEPCYGLQLGMKTLMETHEHA
jgi:nucleoside-diphosphate-sugar epimerase